MEYNLRARNIYFHIVQIYILNYFYFACVYNGIATQVRAYRRIGQQKTFILSRCTRAWHASTCIKCVSSVRRIKIKSSLVRDRMTAEPNRDDGILFPIETMTVSLLSFRSFSTVISAR